MNTSLYRKYRSNNFDEVIGQSLIKKILLNSVKLGRISHAYIFSGPHGIGKTSVSRIFAKAINCLKNLKGDCCNKCNNCNLINNSNTGDLIELDAASNNGVDDIREVIENVNYLPQNLKYKIYIIDEVHMLSNNAWNALLKTVEDPPKHVIFIFATTELNKIPLTIVSRCQKYDFSKISNHDIANHLEKIANLEKYLIDEKAINFLASVANGSVRDSLSMLDQLINCSDEKIITKEEVENLFGLTSIDTRIEILNLIVHQNIIKLIEIFDDLENKGINFLNLCKEILELVIDKIIFIKTKSFKNLKVFSQINIETIQIENNTLYKMVDILQLGINEIRINSDEKFFFEIAIWKCVDLFKLDQKLFLKDNKNKNNILTNENNSNISEKQKDNSNIYLEDVLNIRKSKKNNELNEKKDIEDFYELKRISFEQKIEQPLLKENNLLEIENIFFQIAFNNQKENKKKLNEIFNSLKIEGALNPLENYFLEASKILLVSHNGIVIIFEDDLSSENFNKFFKNKDFILYIKEKFNKIYCVIGLSKKEVKLFSTKYKLLIAEGKTFEDCNNSYFEEILKEEKSIKELAIDFFEKELKGE